MKHLGFESWVADPYVCMHTSTHANGTKYYKYLILCVDNFLFVSDKPKDILQKEIGIYFELKEESTGPPSLYLGGEMRQFVLLNGYKACAFWSVK